MFMLLSRARQGSVNKDRHHYLQRSDKNNAAQNYNTHTAKDNPPTTKSSGRASRTDPSSRLRTVPATRKRRWTRNRRLAASRVGGDSTEGEDSRRIEPEVAQGPSYAKRDRRRIATRRQLMFFVAWRTAQERCA